MKEILVIDDHPIVVFSIERIISSNLPSYKVVTFSETEEILNYVYSSKPSLIIQDLNMDGINPTELLKKIRLINSNIPVLIFSSNSEKTHGRFFLKLGAKGYLNKESSSDEIVNAINRLLEGKTYLSESLSELMTSDLIENRSSSYVDILTNREYDVLIKLLKGLSPSEIANDLKIKPQTVTTFKHNIFEKLGVNNVIELYELIKQQSINY